jgi:hypothetical protein
MSGSEGSAYGSEIFRTRFVRTPRWKCAWVQRAISRLMFGATAKSLIQAIFKLRTDPKWSTAQVFRLK